MAIMPTTTIRLTDDARVAAVAHAEMRADLEAEAALRYARIAATGKTIPWQEMRAWLEKRQDGI